MAGPSTGCVRAFACSSLLGRLCGVSARTPWALLGDPLVPGCWSYELPRGSYHIREPQPNPLNDAAIPTVATMQSTSQEFLR